jgi:hypothetical protein
MEETKTSLFELIAALLLGMGALGGAWSGYQSNQWGGTATADYGKASTIATRGSTLATIGITAVSRDSTLDLQAKQLIVDGTLAKDPAVKQRDLFVAKYLYTQRISEAGYRALGLPPEFRTKDDAKAESLPDEALVAVLNNELDKKYLAHMLADGDAKFAEADKTFKEGEDTSTTSTLFGLAGMFFTVSLFLGGIALVLKSHLRWTFLAAGYAVMIVGAVKMFALPWYHA